MDQLNDQQERLTELDEHARRQRRKGMLWVGISFILCPCHLPITLMVLSFLLGGSALGVVFRDNLIIAGILTTSIWAAGTWYGFRKMRTATCSITPRAK
ncbi:hypothetical protein [Paenibacillus xylaniclasticus]|uniref:hypothetical protein n=1 Tax=Paenibacillus xylaniclasticus TaxID=588083 RepID=UPI0013DFE1A8|nr:MULTISPECIES: hypothetical protein [Paenibacillus]